MTNKLNKQADDTVRLHKKRMHMSREQKTSLLGEPHKRRVTSNKADANTIHNTGSKLNNVTLNNQACRKHMMG